MNHSSRSPTPPPLSKSSSSSREASPVIRHNDQRAYEDYIKLVHHLGKHVFIVVLSMIFGIFAGLSSSTFLSFFARIVLLASALYSINFTFYKQGARSITETFLTAFSVMSCMYFVVSCPFTYFIPALIICTILAVVYHLLA